MITKEQHGNCGKETASKDYETAQKSDSDAMNGFDPGGKGDSTMPPIAKQNIPAEANGQTKSQHLNKIHSELTISSKNSEEFKGEKSKQRDNDSIELSNIPKSEVNNSSLQNTQSLSQSIPNSSVIQIEPVHQQKLSDKQSLEWSKEDNGDKQVAENTNESHTTEDATASILKPKGSSRTRFDERKSFGQLPLLFERATPSYFTPRFDSRVLEEQYWKSSFPRTTRRFQLGLIYLLFLTIALSIYFPAGQRPTWPVFLGLTLGTVSIVAGMLGQFE